MITNECWLWAGSHNVYGYGVLWTGEKHIMAHRAVYESEVSLIPDNMVTDHLCRTRNCVNPSHLDIVTDGVNILRGISTSAVNKRKTHCKFGHAFTPDNTYTYPRGWRGCRTCRTRLNRRQNAKRV